MTMSVHDALEAWQLGEIPTTTALVLAGAGEVSELIELCAACGVEVRSSHRPELQESPSGGDS
ncbi:hypothetical protein Sa4125_30390 [Aureimonas sp. SA4125]|nr:hypothetical protein Sa4125_30390 [Aureimonas sp. SA4125]